MCQNKPRLKKGLQNTELPSLSRLEMQVTYGGGYAHHHVFDNDIFAFLFPTLLTAFTSSVLYTLLRGMPQARQKFTKTCTFYQGGEGMTNKYHPKSVLRYLGIDTYIRTVEKEIRDYKYSAGEDLKNKPLLTALVENNRKDKKGFVEIFDEYPGGLKSLYELDQSPAFKDLHEYYVRNKVPMKDMKDLARQLKENEEEYIQQFVIQHPDSHLSKFCTFLSKKGLDNYDINEHLWSLRWSFKTCDGFRKNLWEVINDKYKSLEKLKIKFQAYNPAILDAEKDPELGKFKKYLKNQVYKKAAFFGTLAGSIAFIGMKAAEEELRNSQL